MQMENTVVGSGTTGRPRTTTTTASSRSGRRRRVKTEKPYKGIRMRKWGKWVAEIREPNKRTRIWLGSYNNAIAAAKAHDTAVYYLRGPTTKLNFPDDFLGINRDDPLLSAETIRRMAAEVGARVDALVSGGGAAPSDGTRQHAAGGGGGVGVNNIAIDLNQMPAAENIDG